MPIYEYQCQSCGKRLEKLQKISDEPLTECPECGGKDSLKKLISAAGFRLKGAGWYETDFKSGKKKNIHGSGNGETGSSTSTAGSSSSESSTSK